MVLWQNADANLPGIRTFKLSKDPKFAEKLKDIVGLYVNPPAQHAQSEFYQ